MVVAMWRMVGEWTRVRFRLRSDSVELVPANWDGCEPMFNSQQTSKGCNGRRYSHHGALHGRTGNTVTDELCNVGRGVDVGWARMRLERDQVADLYSGALAAGAKGGQGVRQEVVDRGRSQREGEQ